jgi:hypothetical protein
VKYSFTPNFKLHLQFYLTIPNFYGRNIITKIRLNDLRLFTFSQTGIDQKCQVCGGDNSDYACHFLFDCNPLQMVYDQDYQPVEQYISNLSTTEKISSILLTHEPLSSNIPFIHKVGYYLSKLWLQRQTILSESNVV